MHDFVRVVKLPRDRRSLVDEEPAGRAPLVGDVARIVHRSPVDGSLEAECVDELGRTVWAAELAPDEVELANWPQPRRPSTAERVLGAAAVVAGGLLAVLLKQPGWVFLIVAGIVIYHGGRLPKPHP